MKTTTKFTIMRECPYCGQIILWKAGRSIPDGVDYIKTKRHSVVLVHKECVTKGEDAK